MNTMVTADFRTESELMLFLAYALKKLPNHWGKCIPIVVIFTCAVKIFL